LCRLPKGSTVKDAVERISEGKRKFVCNGEQCDESHRVMNGDIVGWME